MHTRQSCGVHAGEYGLRRLNGIVEIGRSSVYLHANYDFVLSLYQVNAYLFLLIDRIEKALLMDVDVLE
jgi:hypothetical protein